MFLDSRSIRHQVPKGPRRSDCKCVSRPHHLQIAVLSRSCSSYYILRDEALRILIDPVVDIVSFSTGVNDWEVSVDRENAREDY